MLTSRVVQSCESSLTSVFARACVVARGGARVTDFCTRNKVEWSLLSGQP